MNPFQHTMCADFRLRIWTFSQAPFCSGLGLVSTSMMTGLQATLQKPAPLTVRGVFKTMKQIAAEKGNGSGTRKQRAVLGLLRSARSGERVLSSSSCNVLSV